MLEAGRCCDQTARGRATTEGHSTVAGSPATTDRRGVRSVYGSGIAEDTGLCTGPEERWWGRVAEQEVAGTVDGRQKAGIAARQLRCLQPALCWSAATMIGRPGAFLPDAAGDGCPDEGVLMELCERFDLDHGNF